MIPITKRLLACADLIPPGARVADIGCDHGYLGIYLLHERRAAYVAASDLREKPLQSAEKNARQYGVTDMEFVRADGLDGIDPERVDTIVCAGMGGDLIRMVLEASPWALKGRHTLVLQPQSSQYELRMWLAEKGFAIDRETPVDDGGHVYSVMRLRYTGVPATLAPPEAFISREILQSGSPDLTAFLNDTVRRLEQATENMKNAKEQPEKLRFFETALEGAKEVRKRYADGR